MTARKAESLLQICECRPTFSFASPKENAGASEMTTAERAAASDVSYPLCSFLPFQTANAALVCGLGRGFRFPLRLP